MVTTAGHTDWLTGLNLSQDSVNSWRDGNVSWLEQVGQSTQVVVETASRIAATLPEASGSIFDRVTAVGSQVVGKGVETVSSARTAIAGNAQKAVGMTLTDWLNAHPLLSWWVTHPLYTIAAILLMLLLLSGLLRAFGRMTEQLWLFVLGSPFKLGQWLLGMATAIVTTRKAATQPIPNPQERLAEILTRLEAIQQEQESLMQEIKTILTSRNG